MAIFNSYVKLPEGIIDQASLRNAARGSKEELLLSLSSVHEDSSETE